MIGAWLLVGCSIALQAGVAADDDLKLDVRRLVRQLDSPLLADRETAEAALLELGPDVLELLPPTSDRTPAEVRLRVERVRRTLQQQAAQTAADASLVTFDSDGWPLSKVLAALSDQSGNAIVDFRRRFGHAVDDPAITVRFDKTPFWKALDEVLDQAGMTVYPYGPERAIHLVARAEGQGLRSAQAWYSGPFRFEPLRVVAQRDLRAADGDWLRVLVEVAWEPKLRPIVMTQPMAKLEVVDSGGETLPLLLDASAVQEIAARDDAIAVELQVPLQLPPRDVDRIGAVRGTLGAMLPGKVETFRFDKLLTAKDVQVRHAGARVTLGQVRRYRDLWQVLVRVRFDEAGEALQSHRGWIFRNEAYLEDADGNKIRHDVFETVAQSRSEERRVGKEC